MVAGMRNGAMAMMLLAMLIATKVTAADLPANAGRDDKIFDLLDDNNDGRISREEFKNNQMLVFYLMDRNKDLALTRAETTLPADNFARLAGSDGKIGPLEFLGVADAAFTQADANHDGALDRREFTVLLQHIRTE